MTASSKQKTSILVDHGHRASISAFLETLFVSDAPNSVFTEQHHRGFPLKDICTTITAMSSGNKAIELQMQMRQNTEDLQNFMRELNSWEADIKKKDVQLRTGNEGESSKNIPPVRNKDFKKKKRKTKSKLSDKDAHNEDKKSSRIKSYDYQAWEKFDVDKALDSVDKEESQEESNESDSEDGAVKVDQEAALAEKEKGNQLFKQGKYDDALECYTRGMDADPHNPILPTNRAACFLRLKKYAVAESDCNLSIALDSKYVKAYARRGAARFALGNYHSALEDYETVLKLEPGNLEAQNELKKVKEALAKVGPSDKGEQGKVRETVIDPALQKKLEEQQKRQEAVLHKDRGNAYFKEGKYEAAVECYTQGMEVDTTNVLLPANRAMAYLKLERYAEAEDDCSIAIALDGTYSKALARRGTARAALGKLQEAKADFEKVLKLEPGNKLAVNELNKIKMDINAGRTSEKVGEHSHRRVIQPISKPPHLRSTKPLRRVEIEEIKGDIAPSDKSLSTAGGSVSLETRVPSPLAVQAESKAKGEGSSLGSSPSAKIQKIEELPDPVSQSPAKGPEGDRSKASGSKWVERLPDASEQATSSSHQESDVPPSPPGNSFQLEADLRKIGERPEMIYRYLKQIQPEAYTRIFQNSLEPEILNQILRILQNYYIKNEKPTLILDILKNLASVRRFDMAVMFMSSAEKKGIQELFETIQQAGLKDASVQALQKKYGV
ncbi:RNA polymerase II-associated protein 3 isoform X1 [Alosa sapidissima]|uniref:RNA polymerase II-associated protein 3 isoform X1 n=2 Tax=Alosa sapidissima TaxID=34773 RepID=UPI001C08D2A1|nr:RNA polymerase II-associated protein 3 isoform X1 [Alosa sapidissima]